MGAFGSLFGSHTQSSRLLRLSTPLGADCLLAESVTGQEGLSEAFSFTITALSLDAAIPLKRLLGQPALLELATAGSSGRRPFHGYLSRVRFDGADGGLARYTLTLEPWTVFLSRGRDSRVFQDMSVPDVLEAVFAPYCGQARLAPAWRFDLLDRRVYPARSLVTQYQESDLALVERLMREEGLFYFFEHQGDRAGPLLGRHELVIADHNGAFRPNVQAAVRFVQSGAAMQEDGIDGWQCRFRSLTNAVDLVSWDYRGMSRRPVSANGSADAQADVVCRDVLGQYAYPTIADGERIAQRQLEAFGAQREVYTGEGAVRTLSPGTTFALLDHPLYDDGIVTLAPSFCVTRVWHAMRNNLHADRRAGGDSGPDQEPTYRNRIEAIPADVKFRSPLRDDAGRLLHPRPCVGGQQTAIVVGPEGAVIHTDRDHRIKIQFHWQRGARSHSRLAHPHADGHVGAPADDSAGTWVRVATSLAPIAGANWGAVALPRVGQEVLVDFLDGDIDRPVVIAALYNGRGACDAQHNHAAYGTGSSTGNAPAWFAGERGAHAHPPVLSGLKSQEMRTSQAGHGGYGQLVFDSTAGQERVSLQRHGRAHDGSAELNLGHLRHQTDNQRLGAAGSGAELKTDHSAALRTGGGMLLSAGGRNSSGQQMDAGEAMAQLKASGQLASRLGSSAEQHIKSSGPIKGGTVPGDTDGNEESESGKPTSAFARADLLCYGAAGIAAVTPASAVFSAGRSSTVIAGNDVALLSQGQLNYVLGKGLTLFTQGNAAKGGSPNEETGIRLHAASGKVSCQSQNGPTSISAAKDVTVSSTTADVTMCAKTHILLTALGAGIQLENGNITITAPGSITFAAGMKELGGPLSVPDIETARRVSELNTKRDLNIQYIDADGNPLQQESIAMQFHGEPRRTVELDDNGRAFLKEVPGGPVSTYQPKRR